MRLSLALLAALLFPLAACATSFGRGVTHYEQAEYPQALERFVAIEGELDGLSPKERARYALYRGLTHFALGNRALARLWLGEAKLAYDEDGRVFSEKEAGKLGSALAHLPNEGAQDRPDVEESAR